MSFHKENCKCVCGKDVFMTAIFFNVTKFGDLVPLSFRISCKFFFLRVCLKVSSLLTSALHNVYMHAHTHPPDTQIYIYALIDTGKHRQTHTKTQKIVHSMDFATNRVLEHFIM
jgi:hypothetical protein